MLRKRIEASRRDPCPISAREEGFATLAVEERYIRWVAGKTRAGRNGAWVEVG